VPARPPLFRSDVEARLPSPGPAGTVLAQSPAVPAAPAISSLPLPVNDPESLWAFGVHGVPLTQYLRWADDAGVFVAMADGGSLTVEEVATCTSLKERGAEAMLGVLCSVGLASVNGAAYRLADVACEFLDRRKPYYLGPSLYGMLNAPLPPQLRKGDRVRRYSQFTGTIADALRYLRKKNQFGRREQLLAQHRRNLPVAVVGARSGLFKGVRHLADIGGGSGAFAIPLALAHPTMRITLVELPRALRHIPEFLARHRLTDRIQLLGFNMHSGPWPLEGCDAVLFGNIFHFCDDEECLHLLAESHRILQSGGRVFVHEMLWNDGMDGPVATALWNFWMATMSAGRQRTRAELQALLSRSGFSHRGEERTLAGFTLAVAERR
jgi:ubiquinone/menaquinone biosynthesis C-methylase UbiE